MLSRAEIDPDIFNTIKALQGNASRGLERLSDELYSKSTHFLLEFVQNADDNSYASGVIPTLCFKLEDGRISIQCNEVGFKAENVVAICKIGASTKKNVQGYIGEKGIGFKSVFRVADVVHIHSGHYTFKLDRKEELGMITPIWTPCSVVQGWTSFYLELSRSENPTDLATRFDEIQSSLLLFLRKLRTLRIDIALSNTSRNKQIEIRALEEDSNVVTLERTDNGISSSQRYFIVKHMTPTYPDEKRRENIRKSEIVLAFPIDKNGGPQINQQPVHAFLPLRNYGFTFIIQADFLTSANREDILSDLVWNVKLRSGIIDAFTQATERFKLGSTLQFTWFRFLPTNIHNPFFCLIENIIIQRLKNLPIFCTGSDVFKKPSEFVTVPPAYRDENGEPLIPEDYLPKNCHYLSPKYDNFTDGAHFARLGVEPMSERVFLVGLENMKDRISIQSEAWHELVCCQLYAMHRVRGRVIRQEIQQLHLLPLSDGTWASGQSTNNILFDSKLAGIPQDLGLRLLQGDMPPSSWRHRFFRALGVQEADFRHVANRILELHRSRSWPKSIQSLISHAVFMFVHRFPLPTGLRIMDEKGTIAEGRDVYVDLQDPRQSVRMRDVMRPPARFLHSAYLETDTGGHKEDWWKWLREALGVNVFPRLVDGKPSPEFEALARDIPASQFLVILKETWPIWTGKITQDGISRVSNMSIICENGSEHKINSTYLRRGPLGHYADLPFLPVKLPASAQWQFLRELGVVLHVDPTFFLRRLLLLKSEGKNNDDHSIDKIYKQLETRFEDDPETIRDTFSRDSLVFLPSDAGLDEQWHSLSAIVWSGPPSMTSKIAIKSIYPSLEKFFRTQLKVPSAGPDILAQELKSLGKQWKGTVIPAPVKEQIYAILSNISQVILADPRHIPEWFTNLSDEVIFPVASPSKGLLLYGRDDHFYIPDRSGKLLEMFGSQVPVLATSNLIPFHRIQPILDSPCFSHQMQQLEGAIKRSSNTDGVRCLDVEATRKYSGRAKYIERLVHSSVHLMSVESLTIVDNLRDISIYTVDRIDTTFTLETTLETYSHTREEELVFDDDLTKLSILRTKSCSSLASDIMICDKLADLLHIEMDHLLTIISQEKDMIEVIMKMKGIPEVSERPSRSGYRVDTHIDNPSEPMLHSCGDVGELNNGGVTGAQNIKALVSTTHPLQTHLDAQTQGISDRTDGVARVSSSAVVHTTEIQNIVADASDERRHDPKPTGHVNTDGALGKRITTGSKPDGAAPTANLHSKPPVPSQVQLETEQSKEMFDHVKMTASNNPISVCNVMEPSSDRPSISQSSNRPPIAFSDTETKTFSSIDVDRSLARNPQLKDKIPVPHVFSSDVGKGANTALHLKEGSEDDSYNHWIGLLGEFYVYCLLSNELPDFGPDNWTSELRGKVPGFETYPPGSFGDFTYHDNNGVLTALLYGKDRKATWQDQWPIYYLEVKSTSGGAGEPFYMSKRQVEIASRMAIDDTNRPPKEIFAIVRVSDIRATPSYSIYLDPYRFIRSGAFRIVSDIEVVIST